jgi:hypothetical protein
LISIAPGKPFLNSKLRFVHPSCASPARNTPTRACAIGSFSANAYRHPTRRIRSGTCARVVTGQTVAPASPALNSRRAIIGKSPPRSIGESPSYPNSSGAKSVMWITQVCNRVADASAGGFDSANEMSIRNLQRQCALA